MICEWCNTEIADDDPHWELYFIDSNGGTSRTVYIASMYCFIEWTKQQAEHYKEQHTERG
jgi:hypothetical protein